MSEQVKPYAALCALLQGEDTGTGGTGGRAWTVGEVLTITPSAEDASVGTLLTATAGNLPLDTDDIVFMQHTSDPVAVGERLMLLPDTDGQVYYCIGRFVT